MTDTEPGTELVLAHTGEIVNLADEHAIAKAYKEVDQLDRMLVQAKVRLREALGERAKVLGTKTIYVEGVGKVEVKGATITSYPEPEILEADLRALGCPEEIIREIVVEVVSYKVDGARAKRAASANPEYAKVIEAARQVIEKTPSIYIS